VPLITYELPGMMEYWNSGMMGLKVEKSILIIKNSFKPIFPLLQYSNCGVKRS
jgi:hypothetical protein